MNNLSIIHSIENKDGHNFEENAKFYIESAKEFDQDYFKNNNVNFLQMSDFNITKGLHQYLNDNNILFKKAPIKQKQIQEDTNYTIITDVCKYYSNKLNTEYMIWHDLDVYFLDKVDWNEHLSDTIKLNIIPLIEYNPNDDEFNPNNFNILYEKYFKDYLHDDYKVDSLKYAVNTWMIIGKTSDPFWSEWNKLTYMLVDIIQMTPDLVEAGYESIAEEIAASILYERNKNKYQGLGIEFSLFEAHNNTKIYHYEEFNYLIDDSFHNNSRVINLMRASNILGRLMVLKKISIKDIQDG